MPVPGGPKSRIPRQGVRFPATEPGVKASVQGPWGPQGQMSPLCWVTSPCAHAPAAAPCCGARGPSPRVPVTLTGKQVWELDGQDHGFLQGLLGSLQAGHVTPPHVGLLHHDGTCEAAVRAPLSPPCPPHNPKQPAPPDPFGHRALTTATTPCDGFGGLHTAVPTQPAGPLPISCSCSFFFSGFSPSLSLSLLGRGEEVRRGEAVPRGRAALRGAPPRTPCCRSGPP